METRLKCNNFNDAIIKASGKKFAFVTLLGPSNSGKSISLNFLANLAYRDLQIKPETEGTFIYGPFSCNSYRSELSMDPLEDDIQIFFVDTKTVKDFTTNNLAALSEVVPSIILSKVIITFANSSMTQEEICATKAILEIADNFQYFKDYKLGNQTNIISKYLIADEINNESIRKEMNQLSTNFGLKTSKNFLFEDCNFSNLIFYNQSEKFRYSFGDLLASIVEEVSKAPLQDAKKVDQIYGEIRTTKIGTILNLHNAQNKNLLVSMSSKFVDGIIKDKICYLQQIHENLEIEFLEKEVISDPLISFDRIRNDLISQINLTLPNAIKKMEIYNEFKLRISKEITAKCTEFSDILRKIRKAQFKYIKRKIDAFVEKRKFEILKEIYPDDVTEVSEADCVAIINGIYKQMKVCRTVDEKVHDYMEKFLAKANLCVVHEYKNYQYRDI